MKMHLSCTTARHSDVACCRRRSRTKHLDDPIAFANPVLGVDYHNALAALVLRPVKYQTSVTTSVRWECTLSQEVPTNTTYQVTP